MAPTLKEVDAVLLTAATVPPRTPVAAEINRESKSSGTLNDNNAAALATAPPPAVALPSPPLLMQLSAKSVPMPTKPIVTTTIVRENPNDIPPDESAFLIEPHFSRHNPFHRNLSNLDLAMRCAICSELYHAPVTLIPCMHAFCSLCVRNHFKSTLTGMKRKVDCPKCNEPVRMPGSSDYEKGILPNKQLEELVDAYTLCRDQMRESLVRLDLFEKEMALGKDMAALTRKVRKHDEDLTKDCGIRSSKRIRTMVKKVHHSSDSDVDDDNDDEDDTGDEYVVPRNLKNPVSQEIPTQTLTQEQHQLRRKPTVNYHSLKKKQLVELCLKEGLNTHGSDTDLKKRHSDFITLYNSECDSAHPRSVRELLAEIRTREACIRREAERAGTGHQSALMRNLAYSLESRREGDNTMPTSRDATFDAKLNNNFAVMIASLKKQREDQASSSSSRLMEILNKANDGDQEKNQRVTSAGYDTAIQDVTYLQEHPSALIRTYANSEDDNVVPASKVAAIDSKPLVETTSGFKQVGEEYVDQIKPFGHETAIRCDVSVTSPQQQSMVPSTVLTDSKPIAGTPRLAVRQALLSDHTATTATKLVSTAKPKYVDVTKRTASRISSLGPWVCRACTFHNMRNITKKARCEMCDAVRPIELGSGRRVEVVNIEC